MEVEVNTDPKILANTQFQSVIREKHEINLEQDFIHEALIFINILILKSNSADLR